MTLDPGQDQCHLVVLWGICFHLQWSTVLGVGWCPGRLDVFGAGGNSELLHWWSTVDGTNWNGPESFDSGMWTNSKPTVVSWGPGRLDVYGVGFDHELLHRWFDGTSWNGPVSRGGILLFSTSQDEEQQYYTGITRGHKWIGSLNTIIR